MEQALLRAVQLRANDAVQLAGGVSEGALPPGGFGDERDQAHVELFAPLGGQPQDHPLSLYGCLHGGGSLG